MGGAGVFSFPPRAHATCILGPERAVWLLGGTPALVGREGYAEVCRLLPAMHLELARAHGAALPPSIARRLGVPDEPADEPMFPEFPGTNDDTPHA
ncbi:MAG: hypothetical protein C0497_03760 [Gemmatimonas sp.]|nr:hypothetical protein [Gemmatimonas sp.]